MGKSNIRQVDWIKTGYRLLYLREHNAKLEKKVCKYLQENGGNRACGCRCDSCSQWDMHISRNELGQYFNYTENSIANYELGRSQPGVEVLLAYAELCELPLEEILIFEPEK